MALDFLKSIGVAGYRSLEIVSLPRRTVLRNIRLGLTLRLLQVGTAIGFFYTFLKDAQWVKVVQPARMGVHSAWDDANASEYGLASQRDVASTLCTDGDLYNYVYSAAWRYEDYTCTVPHSLARRMRKEGDDIIFVPTSYEETRYTFQPASENGTCPTDPTLCPSGFQLESNLMGNDLCRCSSREWHFVAGVDALKLSVAHSYDMFTSDPLSLIPKDSQSAQASDVECSEDGNQCDMDAQDGKTHELRTFLVVQNSEREETLLGMYDSPSPLQIPLSKVMEALQVTLDSDSITNKNLLNCGTEGAESNCSDTFRVYPTLRQTGMVLDIQLEYANQLVSVSLPCDDCFKDHIGPVCKITISSKSGVWSSRLLEDCDVPRNSVTGSAQCTSRYEYGIKIKFLADGRFGKIDPLFIVVTLGAGLVYLGIPLVLIDLLASFLLGALSNVYKKADREEVHLPEQTIGFIMRTITAQAAFQVKSLRHSFKVTVDKNADSEEELGLVLRDTYRKDGKALLVVDIKEGSMIQKHNEAEERTNDGHVVRIGDFVTAANGKRGGAARIREELQRSAKVILSIEQEFISRDRMVEMINEVCASHGTSHLDQEEQERVANLVMGSLGNEDGRIHLHEFVSAVSSSDPINLKDAVKLFDKDRKLSALEWLFTPKSWERDAESKSEALGAI
jgi:Ca2+-binding EF-hand superfamily protein